MAEDTLTPDLLLRRWQELNHQQTTELDKIEAAISKKYVQMRRKLLRSAGHQTAMLAGLGEAYEAEIIGYD